MLPLERQAEACAFAHVDKPLDVVNCWLVKCIDCHSFLWRQSDHEQIPTLATHDMCKGLVVRQTR